MKDDLYKNSLGDVGRFVFDQRVARVFADMIQRSVPGYQSVIEMTGVFAAQFYQNNSRCYDLGCSLGASALSVAQQLGDNANIVAIDNSRAMLDQCAANLDNLEINTRQIEFRCEDILETEIESASFVILNYTLQFVPLEKRTELIGKIHRSLLPGGALLISEKIRFEDPVLDSVMTELHHDYKENRGYTRLEISQKRKAIDDVLIPESIDAHRSRLQSTGFDSVSPWFQCLNFCSFLAIKS